MGSKNFKKGLDMLIQNTAVETENSDDADNSDKNDSSDKEKKITITVPDSLKRKIKNYCANNDITIKNLFIKSVNAYIE